MGIGSLATSFSSVETINPCIKAYISWLIDQGPQRTLAWKKRWGCTKEKHHECKKVPVDPEQRAVGADGV